MDALRYSLDQGRQLVISGETVEELLEYRQTGDEPEAGGLLVGMYMKEDGHLYIDRLTTPLSCDRRFRFKFFRSLMHNVKLRRIWRKSGGTRIFVGSWHTHPEPDPTPSKMDLKDWGRLLKRGKYYGDELFFVIIGTMRIKVWKAKRGTNKLIQLERVGENHA